MERFVIIVNSWKPLTITTKRSILDVAAGLDLPLLRNIPLFRSRPEIWPKWILKLKFRLRIELERIGFLLLSIIILPSLKKAMFTHSQKDAL